MTARAPNLTEKLAATILAWLRAAGNPIPFEHAQAMSAQQICSLVEFDHHPRRRVDGGTNHPSNLDPLLRAEHRTKTSTIDVPQIRKADRLSDAHAEFRRTILSRPCGQKRQPKGRIRSRGFGKARRPMRRAQST